MKSHYKVSLKAGRLLYSKQGLRRNEKCVKSFLVWPSIYLMSKLHEKPDIYISIVSSKNNNVKAMTLVKWQIPEGPPFFTESLNIPGRV